MDWKSSFSVAGLQKLGDTIASSAREFEASLAQPLIPTPPRSTAASSSRQTPASPSPQPAAASPTGKQRTAISSSTPTKDASSSSSSSSSSAVPPPVATAVQSASQLADTALSSLRMSLRKGRASLDSATRRSIDVSPSTPTRASASDLDRRVASPSTPTVKEEELVSFVSEPAAAAQDVSSKAGELNDKDGDGDDDDPFTAPATTKATRVRPEPPNVEPASVPVPETPRASTAALVSSDAPATVTVIQAHSPSPSPSPLLPTTTPTTTTIKRVTEPVEPTPSSPSPPPLLRPDSPDARFAIATPEGTSRATTPAGTTDPVEVDPLAAAVAKQPYAPASNSAAAASGTNDNLVDGTDSPADDDAWFSSPVIDDEEPVEEAASSEPVPVSVTKPEPARPAVQQEPVMGENATAAEKGDEEPETRQDDLATPVIVPAGAEPEPKGDPEADSAAQSESKPDPVAVAVAAESEPIATSAATPTPTVSAIDSTLVSERDAATLARETPVQEQASNNLTAASLEVDKAQREAEPPAESTAVPDLSPVAPTATPAGTLEGKSTDAELQDDVVEPTVNAASVPEPSREHVELVTLKATLDRVVAELLPTLSSGVSDPEEFERELKNLTVKNQLAMSEVARLTAQLAQQKERLQEVRDTHRLEERSQSDQVGALSTQLTAKEADVTRVTEELARAKEEIQTLKDAQITATEEQDKLRNVAKEEEEKRTKALSLLRALRQKLVKAEKDKEEAEKEKDTLKASETAAQDTLRGDRARFDQEIVSLRAAQELQLNKLRQSFDREVASLKAQHDREASAKKGQYELDAITAKALHAKELQSRDGRIAQLETTVKEITAARDALFDQVQLRTAEVESSTTHQEALQSRTAELQYELKEARDRVAALVDELEDMRKTQRDATRDDSAARRLLAEADKRHEGKVRELEARAAQLERDRQESEQEMSRNLQDRLKEVNALRQQIVQKDVDYAQSVHLQQQRDAKIEESETKRRELETKVKNLETALSDLKADVAKSLNGEAAVREELNERSQRLSELEQRLEEVQNKESLLRSNNKTLREELRKLQSGVLLSEKQRQPGVGYFASYQKPSEGSSASASTAMQPLSPTGSDGPRTPKSQPASLPESVASTMAPKSNGSATSSNGEEAVNFEYMRNVILQFLERPDMRPHLLGVLGVILHFTPAEARRLAAKAKAS